jgi:hypothetical protein
VAAPAELWRRHRIMMEAVWSVEFLSSTGAGGCGIAVFDAGRICGGNDTLIYTGRYEVVDGLIVAHVKVETYAINPSSRPGLGFVTWHLNVTGSPDRQNLFLVGHDPADPSRTTTIRAVRRAELP